MDIKNVIQHKGLMMSQAAELMGITPQALSQIINGNPTVKKIEALAKAIGCSPAEFFADWKKSPADELPFDNGVENAENTSSAITNHAEQEGKSAPGMFICPHCGKGVSIRVEEI